MFGLVADISLRSVAAAAAVGLVLVALRVRSGAARHAAWSAVLVVMLTMPVLMAIVPVVHVPHLPSLALDPGTIAVEPISYDASVASNTAIEPDAELAVASAAIEHQSSPAVSSTVPFQWDTLAFALYAAGLLFFLIRLVAGWLFARRLVVSASGVDCANDARVCESSAIATPVTTGILSPVVLLPTSWREWPDDKLAAVLAHENAHIVRRDALVTFLAHLNRAIFWFHPLAWWLERTLAVTAEHACDDAAARRVGEPRRYAEILLDMAEAVRLRGRRVSWQAIGVEGSGALGARIDRVLRGDGLARMSAPRRAAVAAGCAAVLVLAVACRQQIAAEPLRPDPEVQRQIDENSARSERHRAAVAMSADEAAALEAALETNPDDLYARESLIIFYDQSGKVTWEEKLAGIRRHALWRIAHLPETDLWIPSISARYDPEGYAEAKRLWLEQTSRPDVKASTLGRAALFLGARDTPIAEELLVRARQMEPAGPWTSRLADLYARSLVGHADPRSGPPDPAESPSPFAAETRRRLDASRDPDLLAATGSALLLQYSRPAAAVGADALGHQLLERAAALDPANLRARRALAHLRHNQRAREIQSRLAEAGARDAFHEFTDTTYEAISALPEEDRLFYLPAEAEVAYMRAEYIDYTWRVQGKSLSMRADDTAGAPRVQAKVLSEEAPTQAARGWQRSRQYARDALALAERHRKSPDHGAAIYRAHVVLGLLALKDGDRRSSVDHMRRAAAAPAVDEMVYVPGAMRARLVEYLLREGERESVVQFLEASAERFPFEREQLLADAARIRAGVMPLAFQFAEAQRQR
jgi:beta-lactamase regulating signal transducer with metallopeptidase domain